MRLLRLDDNAEHWPDGRLVVVRRGNAKTRLTDRLSETVIPDRNSTRDMLGRRTSNEFSSAVRSRHDGEKLFES